MKAKRIILKIIDEKTLWGLRAHFSNKKRQTLIKNHHSSRF
jgi:hypothetical protein